LAPSLIVARLDQSTTGAAVDVEGFVGISGIQIAQAGRSRARCIRESLLAVLSRRDRGVLKSLALLWTGLRG
jgi:hypothetical protein